VSLASADQPAARKLIVAGTGRQSVSIVELVEDINTRCGPQYDVLGFLDDAEALWGTRVIDYPVLGPIAAAPEHADAYFLNGIYSLGNLPALPDIVRRMQVGPERWATLVHPLAWLPKRLALGFGVVIYPFAFVYPRVEIGDLTLLLPGSVVGGQTRIGRGCAVAGHAVVGAQCQLGDGCYVGQGATIRERVSIGPGAVVGMGAVVVKDVPAGAVVAGNPAQPLPGR
jgi:sugar O-acyltransferase (sialic acid O-acetyltransferase NeuD family)